MLSGHKIAIVADVENTTRDILEYQMEDEDNEMSYILVDSGGLTQGSRDEVLKDVRIRSEHAIRNADIILFVIEYDKFTDLDIEIAHMLRKSGKIVFVLANKADNPMRSMQSNEFSNM
jgi:GTP-binding protein